MVCVHPIQSQIYINLKNNNWKLTQKETEHESYTQVSCTIFTPTF